MDIQNKTDDREQSSLIAKINEKMSEFSKSQRLIGNFITNHYEQAAYMTALKLGSAVGVSESTVVRFAIEMGYEGYPEMQRDLQSYSKTRLTALQRLNITNHRIDPENVFKSVLLQDIERIKATVMMIEESRIGGRQYTFGGKYLYFRRHEQQRPCKIYGQLLSTYIQQRPFCTGVKHQRNISAAYKNRLQRRFYRLQLSPLLHKHHQRGKIRRISRGEGDSHYRQYDLPFGRNCRSCASGKKRYGKLCGQPCCSAESYKRHYRRSRDQKKEYH